MAYFVNGFQPQTAIGASLANLSQALFSGQVTPNQRKQLELEQQKTEAYIRGQDASAAFDSARAASEADMLNGRRDFGANQLRVRFGDKGNQIRNYVTEGVGDNPLEGMNPDDMRFVNALFQTGDAVRAGGGNADQIMSGAQTAQDMGIKEAFLKGNVSPTQYAVTDGKEVVGYDDSGVRYNKFDLSIPQVTDALFDANVGLKKAQAGKETAQASKYINDIKIDNNKAGKADLVATFAGYDEAGNEVYGYAPKSVDSTFKKPPKKADASGGLVFNPKKPSEIDGAIKSALGMGENDILPDGMMTEIRTELSDLAAKAGTKGFTEPMLSQAIANVSQRYPDAQITNTNWWDTNRPLKDSAPKSPPKPQTQNGKPESREAMLRREAQQAIDGGADPVEVNKRLQQLLRGA